MNNLCITGRLTKDPELRYTSNNNTAVASFSIAVDDGFGEKKKTYFFPCTAWEKTAENIAKFFQKGDPIAISGKLSQRCWDKDGQKHQMVEVVALTFDFMGGKKGETKKPDNADQGDFYPLDENDELPF